MTDAGWFATNRAAIEARLAFLRDLPDGVLYDQPGDVHNVRVCKAGTCLELHFYGGEVTDEEAEVVSDLDFARPLHLWAGFTQAMMLGLLWKPQPWRVYVLGFGAGRVPMVLHHHFPQVRIDATDIDPHVPEVAARFFGIQPDERLNVAVADGRKYLERLDSSASYDIILIDAFSGLGYSPFPLATKEFYQLCTSHLAEGGVVVINLMASDPLIQHKLRTLIECFRDVQVVTVPEDGTIALFASHVAPRTLANRVAQAEAIQAARQFESPFVEHARRLQPLTRLPEVAQVLPRTSILSDGERPPPPNDAT
jgi:spermidine synthase